MWIGIDGNEANVVKRVGSNIYAFNILKWLRKLADADRFTIYLKKAPLPDFPDVTQHWNYRILKPGFLWTRWRLPLELYMRNPRPGVFFTPGHYAPKFCPMPLAVSIMDLSFLYYPKLFRRKDLYSLTHWTRDSIERASHIFTISQFTKDDIITNYAIPEEKITVTYPGIDPGRLEKKRSPQDIQRVKVSYNIEGKYLLYIGTLQPRKNLSRLIQAFAQIEDEHLTLVIAGKKGWLYAKILEEARGLGGGKRVVFTGYTKDEDTPALIEGAEALVLVSLYEGFGIPVLEAMALGVPTVVSKESSLSEIVGEIGIAVNPKDVKSISRGLSRSLHINESQRKEIFVKSKDRAKKFSWKKTAEKTLEVLHAIAVS